MKRKESLENISHRRIAIKSVAWISQIHKHFSSWYIQEKLQLLYRMSLYASSAASRRICFEVSTFSRCHLTLEVAGLFQFQLKYCFNQCYISIFCSFGFALVSLPNHEQNQWYKKYCKTEKNGLFAFCVPYGSLRKPLRFVI